MMPIELPRMRPRVIATGPAATVTRTVSNTATWDLFQEPAY